MIGGTGFRSLTSARAAARARAESDGHKLGRFSPPDGTGTASARCTLCSHQVAVRSSAEVDGQRWRVVARPRACSGAQQELELEPA